MNTARKTQKIMKIIPIQNERGATFLLPFLKYLYCIEKWLGCSKPRFSSKNKKSQKKPYQIHEEGWDQNTITDSQEIHQNFCLLADVIIIDIIIILNTNNREQINDIIALRGDVEIFNIGTIEDIISSNKKKKLTKDPVEQFILEEN